MGKPIDLAGRIFTRWTVLRSAGRREYPSGGTRPVWHCRCECGNESIVEGDSLVRGKSKSCGCLADEYKHSRKETNIKHGCTGTRLHNVWKGMKQRCSDPNHQQYHRYGGRGITVCDEWQSFESFRNWATANGYDETAPIGKCTIDRIDNNMGYCPSNCRFVDMKVQYHNNNKPKSVSEIARENGFTAGAILQRISRKGMSLEEALSIPQRPRFRMISYNGATKSMTDWASELGVSLQTIACRLNKHGWTVEEALNIPAGGRRQK